jgi:hypothetical protein
MARRPGRIGISGRAGVAGVLDLGLSVKQLAVRGRRGTRILLSSIAIAENASVGDTIGTLSVIRGSGSYTFTITADPDSKFSITGSALKVGAALNYETKTSHLVTVQASNGVDTPISRVFTILVLDVADSLLPAPAAPTLTLVSGAGDNQPDFLVEAANADLPVDAVVTIYAYSDVGLTTLVDTGQGTVAVAGSITITNQLGPLADGPYWYNADTSIAGHSTSAKSNTENNTIDTTAPTVTSSNTDTNAENSVLAHALAANETVAWSIVGGADQAQFELSGSTLRWASNGTQNFEAPADADTNNAYVVQVRATDVAGNTTNQTITVTVTDVGGESTLKTGLISLWEFETTGWADAHGTNTLTGVNSPTTTTGKVGNGAHIVRASTQALTHASNSDLQVGGGQDFSIALWINFDSGPGGHSIAFKSAGGSGNQEWSLETANDGTGNKFHFEIFNASSVSDELFSTTFGNPAASTWYFVVMTFNGSTGLMTLSVNAGTRDTFTSAKTIPNTASGFNIGAGDFDGIIDQMGLWKKVLTTGEETQLYNAGAGLSYAAM